MARVPVVTAETVRPPPDATTAAEAAVCDTDTVYVPVPPAVPVNCARMDVPVATFAPVSAWPAASTAPAPTAETVITWPAIDAVTLLTAIAPVTTLAATEPVTLAAVGGVPVAAKVTAPVAKLA